MERFIKLPIIAYESKAYNRYTQQLSEELEDDGDIDSLIERQSKNKWKYDGDQIDRPAEVITHTRLAISLFQGCSYEPAISLPDKDEQFSEKMFNASCIYFADESIMQVNLHIDDLEDLLIAHEIVHPDIKKQFSKSRL